MTDGIWNGDENISAPAQHDGASFTLADNETYNGTRAPYADSTSTKTLADYAMHYWANDLRPGLDNNLPPFIYSAEVKDDYWDPRNDPATWQHMVNFTMGLAFPARLIRATGNGRAQRIAVPATRIYCPATPAGRRLRQTATTMFMTYGTLP